MVTLHKSFNLYCRFRVSYVGAALWLLFPVCMYVLSGVIGRPCWGGRQAAWPLRERLGNCMVGGVWWQGLGCVMSTGWTCSMEIFERKAEPTTVKMGGVGGSSEIDIGSDCSGDVVELDRFCPAGVMCCHLTATVWRRAANGLPQQLCNVWCSCVLTVCSVLQSVHCSKVMLAAERKVTCTVHWQLWARLWDRGDQVRWINV